MARLKLRPLGYVLVAGYLLAVALLYTSLPFWDAAVSDFLLTLLLLGLLAILHRREFPESIIWDSMKKGKASHRDKEDQQ